MANRLAEIVHAHSIVEDGETSPFPTESEAIKTLFTKATAFQGDEPKLSSFHVLLTLADYAPTRYLLESVGATSESIQSTNLQLTTLGRNHLRQDQLQNPHSHYASRVEDLPQFDQEHLTDENYTYSLSRIMRKSKLFAGIDSLNVLTPQMILLGILSERNSSAAHILYEIISDSQMQQLKATLTNPVSVV